MSSDAPLPLLAIDVGNTRVKAGVFAGAAADCVESAQSGVLPIASARVPEPVAAFSATAEELAGFAEWVADELASLGRVVIASVSQPTEDAVVAALRDVKVERLTSETLPIRLDVEQPESLGVDRAVAAVAANRLRHAGKPAIVVDVGTAITVDLIDEEGVFLGGAILPGPGLAARALAEKTDRLPDVRFGELDTSPDAVGRATEPAIRAGVYWGAVGSIRELIARQRDRCVVPPQVFLTGGAAPSFARLIGGPDLTVRYLPHLTLTGIAIAAEAILES
ncbi:MAG: type III pantothenate kinase [Planctomycetota bacterium]